MKLRDDLKWIAPIVLVSFVVFANSLGGEFVYDDTRQILRNPLIQNNDLVWKALTSDVWAFKGDGTVVASNYWRPTFTAWHILNYRLFGASPAGWHWSNVLLHAGVTLLAFLFLRKIEFSAVVAFAIALIFAVHPVHVETVAWISGSPDLLFSLAFLGSLWFAHTYRTTRSKKHLVLMLLLYALALGAKEIGVICLPLYYFLLAPQGGDKAKTRDFKRPLMMIASVAAGWFLLRLSILRGFSNPPEDAVSLGTAILSVPAMFAFYLRQIFFPYWLSPNYPLEPVTQVGLQNFVLPLVISLAVLGAIFFAVKRFPDSRLGAALFLLLLAPAMNASVFPPEQIVHDRYLYLPLLGALMVIFQAASQFVNERNLMIASAVISLVLSVQTLSYNQVWANELTVWSRASAADPSSFTSTQYAMALNEAGRVDDAIRQYGEAIAKSPRARSHLGRAMALLKKKQYEPAERDLKAVLAFPLEKIDLYALYQAYQALGVLYSEQRNYDAAIRNLTEARTKLPIYSASLSCDLAVVLYQAGQKERALKELEGARVQARREFNLESKAVFMRLGMLYAELGRKDEARAALQEHLALTSTLLERQTVSDRTQSTRLLQSLR